MDQRLAAPHARPGHRLLRVLSLVRYRFFLYAGLLPYLLGAAWAWRVTGSVPGTTFWSGLGGVILAVIGVEAFNEYFDARMGTDRVFNPDDLPPMSDAVMWLGVAGFAGALAVGFYLTLLVGWPILAFAVLGGLAAVFYVAPPVRWAYRGLGETVIALSYGPWMVLGSLYLHAHTLASGALWASLVPGLLIMALAVVNAIPDFQPRVPAGPAESRRAVSRAGDSGADGGADRRGRAGVSARVPGHAAGAAAAGFQRAQGHRYLQHAEAVRAGDPQHRRLLWRRGVAVHPYGGV
jgi:1,4-dihydroxy-2-naphthoate octaprenyltransferase